VKQTNGVDEHRRGELSGVKQANGEDERRWGELRVIVAAIDAIR
jgi:hypothetical protein